MTERFLTAALVAASIGLFGLGSRDVAAQSVYTSPFSIALDPAIASWTSDFPTRQATIYANTSPPQADWYSPSTSYAGRPRHDRHAHHPAILLRSQLRRV
jgi:hypothetical protein